MRGPAPALPPPYTLYSISSSPPPFTSIPELWWEGFGASAKPLVPQGSLTEIVAGYGSCDVPKTKRDLVQGLASHLLGAGSYRGDARDWGWVRREQEPEKMAGRSSLAPKEARGDGDHHGCPGLGRAESGWLGQGVKVNLIKETRK